MKMIYLEEVDSTQRFIKEFIGNHLSEYNNIMVYTYNQTNGIGSRNNNWDGIKGNLFFSFSLKRDDLPTDLPLQSASIYFSYLLKEYLHKLGSSVWIKWPNDFYIKDQKIGGTICQVDENFIYCGIGINLLEMPLYRSLDIVVDSKMMLRNYLLILKKKITWKEVFSKFIVEFQSSKKFTATIDSHKISLENASLNFDGSLQINNKKVYGSR